MAAFWQNKLFLRGQILLFLLFFLLFSRMPTASSLVLTDGLDRFRKILWESHGLIFMKNDRSS